MPSELPQGESPFLHVNDPTETANSSHDTKSRPVSPFDHVNNQTETSGEGADRDQSEDSKEQRE